ncbi:MAG: hypothetical protein CL488_06360 [Acidobacteria bacterium]|nr:hypothetical protein [Acidobacteriota bacterium]MEE2610039.1 DUF177 domain-containing protein [Acidobacteriota bacterium]|tara:strand:- start:513 stop:1028 length:516 start_codon:yes stop_codon:yes gene_type:complete
MLLDLKTLGESRVHLERTYPPSAFEATDEFIVGKPVELVCEVEKIRDWYQLAGHLSTRLRVQCCRCGEGCDTDLDLAFDLRYVSEALSAGTNDAEIDNEDLTVAFYRDDQIDLRQLISEQFYLGLPMKPLCQEDCRGLCAACGKNLNSADCGCSVEWRDPRLAVLDGLLKR